MRIGILEDYQALGNVLQLTLRLAGHTVQTSNTVEDFFANVFYPVPPDLIIVDFLLKTEYSGAQVIREIRKTAPTLPAILISAAPLPTLQAAIAGLAQVTLLQKPFQMSVLRETIRHISTRSTNLDYPKIPGKL